MNETALTALAVVIFGWAILSNWFSRHDLTGPLVFMVAGLLLANSDWGIGSVDVEGPTVHALAELTLALLLFGDASAVPPAAAGGTSHSPGACWPSASRCRSSPAQPWRSSCFPACRSPWPA